MSDELAQNVRSLIEVEQKSLQSCHHLEEMISRLAAGKSRQNLGQKAAGGPLEVGALQDELKAARKYAGGLEKIIQELQRNFHHSYRKLFCSDSQSPSILNCSLSPENALERLERMRTSATAAESKLSEIRCICEERKRELASAREQLDCRAEELTQLRADAEDQARRLHADNERLATRVAEDADLMAAQTSEIQRLRQEADALACEREDARTALSDALERVRGATADNDALRAQLGGMAADADAAQQRAREAEETVGVLTARLQQQKQERDSTHDAFEEERQQLDGAISELQRLRAQDAERIADLGRELAELEKALASAQLKSQTLSEEQIQLNQMLSEREQQNFLLKEQLDVASSQLMELQAEIMGHDAAGKPIFKSNKNQAALVQQQQIQRLKLDSRMQQDMIDKLSNEKQLLAMNFQQVIQDLKSQLGAKTNE